MTTSPESAGNLPKYPQVPEVYSTQLRVVPNDWFGYSNHGAFDETHGIPTDFVEGLTFEILATVEAAGMDLDDVMFSGYSRGSDKGGGGFVQEVDHAAALAELVQDIQDIDEGYTVGDGSVTRDGLIQRINELKRKKPGADKVYTYFFGEPRQLTDLGDSGVDNPLYYTGLIEPVIGVYSKTRLEELATGADDVTYDAVWSIDLTEAEMRSALLLEFHPRFEIGGYED